MHLGIDLGTSNSAIAGCTGTDYRIFKTSEGADVLPSVIYVDKRGHKLFGKRAYDQTLLSPDNVISGFKRLMGTSTKLELKSANLEFTPEECSAEILKHLIGQAFAETGAQEIIGTVITIPAAFNQMQSESTLRAAKLAGLENVALLQEPVAAAMAASAAVKNKNGQFLIYDLGGGTFDLALVQSISGTVSILAHEGINMLGGRDFDRTILNTVVRPWLLENYRLPEDFQKQEAYRRVIRIAQLASERAKIELSTKDDVFIFASDEELRAKDENGKEIFLEVPLKRQFLEQLVKEELSATVELSQKMLKTNGYESGDIDRVVFIGGPTKMPFIRTYIPQQLGIPVDLQIDPMTAVAIGAAIYAESREWGATGTTRKTTRSSVQISDTSGIFFDYPTRISQESAKVKLRVDSNSLAIQELQIDSSTGWTTGRVKLNSEMSFDVPLPNMGKNSFRVTAFNESGKPIKIDGSQFDIQRTLSSSASVPATQTISVRVREGSQSVKNILHPIIMKGTALPAKGSQMFRAARELRGGDSSDHLDFELFQDEGAPEPSHNLGVGVFRISGVDLESGFNLREGEELIFHWNMSDSGLISARIEIPKFSLSIDNGQVYLAQASHQMFDLENGTLLAQNVLQKAEDDIEDLSQSIGDGSNINLEAAKEELKRQKTELANAPDADTTRAVTEKARHIRQKISKIKNDPVHRGKILKSEIVEKKEIFDEYCRTNAHPKIKDKFDKHLAFATDAIAQQTESALKEAEQHILEARSILSKELWRNDEVVINRFNTIREQSYLATDKESFKRLVSVGIDAIKRNDIEEVRRTYFKLAELQVSVGNVDENLTKLSGLLRG